MSKIAVRGGHSVNCVGASALLDEVIEDRKVYPSVIKYLKLAGNEVLDVTSNKHTQREDLAFGVNKANNWGADLFISIHFNNAYKSYNGAIGTETIIYPNSKSAYPYAKRINDNLVNLGFKKHSVGVINATRRLYELRHTSCPAVITEVCFVEATQDVALYRKLGADRIGKAIAEGIVGHSIDSENDVTSTEGFKELRYIKPCMKNSNIKSLQTILKNLKYYKSKVDGVFGSHTQDAVLDYQKEHTVLNKHAIVDKKTWDSIMAHKPTKKSNPIKANNINGKYGRVNANILNVRENPKGNSEIIGKLSHSQKVKLFKDCGNGWYSIYYGQKGGYVSKKYIKII